MTINNGPVNFAINMQDANFNSPFGFTDITINAGPIINTADHLQVWTSDQGSIFDYTVDNYTTTDFFLPMEGGTVFLGTNFFKDQPVVSVTNATLGFFHNITDQGGVADNLSLGHTSLVAACWIRVTSGTRPCSWMRQARRRSTSAILALVRS